MDFSNLFEFFISPIYFSANCIWNNVIRICLTSGIKGPAEYDAAWKYTVETLNPFFVAIAAVMMNMFFYIGFCRQVGNLKENMTLETCVNIFIKMIICNLAVNLSLRFSKSLFGISKITSEQLIFNSDFGFFNEIEINDAVAFQSIMGIIYLIVALCCSATVFLTMFTRIIHLYLLAATGPLAMSCIPGGPGIQNSAGAWIREMIAKSCTIITISLGVCLISKVTDSMIIFADKGVYLRGVGKGIENMFKMALIAAFVKSADSFTKRTFGL